MKEQPRIADLIKNVNFEGFLLVKNAAQKTASTGSKYLDMTLVDISGEINAKMWDGIILPPPNGSTIKVRAQVQEFKEHLQLRIDKMRMSVGEDEVDMNQLIPCAPRPADDMMDEILNRADAIKDKEMKALVLKRLEEAGDKLMLMPAALKLHHAQRSGLLNHTTTMLRGAQYMCELYPFLDADLLAAGVILHDLCKIEEMNCNELGLVTEYSAEGNLLGHIVMGVSRLDRCGRELGVDSELLMMLEHMILSHHETPEFGSPKGPMFPEAEVLHLLDDMDAKMFEMKSDIEKVNPGSFTEPIWSLDNRKLYRRKNPGDKQI